LHSPASVTPPRMTGRPTWFFAAAADLGRDAAAEAAAVGGARADVGRSLPLTPPVLRGWHSLPWQTGYWTITGCRQLVFWMSLLGVRLSTGPLLAVIN
jgi:hypothetical protein